MCYFFGGLWVIAVDGESGRSFRKKTSKGPVKRALDGIDLLFLLAVKCTNMFNRRREW